MTTPRYPAEQVLPAEVASPGARLLPFQRYPVFGWHWYGWRLLVLTPIALLGAYVAGNTHGSHAHDAMQGFAVGWREAVANMLLVAGGPLLATYVRRLHWQESREYALLVVAVLVGMVAADSAGRWADGYHDQLMNALGPRATHAGQGASFAAALWELMRTGAIYFVFGGGWDLRSFLHQKERWRRYCQQQELAQVQAQKHRADLRLAILQAQVEPHFLFNTLASVRSLVRGDPVRAEATIAALVDHLRATLPKLRDDDVHSTLADQTEICRSYLEVMRVRMGARLRYAVDVPAELATAPFPPLMLVSLVENAIKHGVERKPGPCTVTVTARLVKTGQQAVLEVVVSDDGAGLSVGPSSGLGLANIRAQLSARFEQQASVSLEQRAGGGAQAAIRIPLARS
jgi:signal transduction histidine kinase